MRFLPFQVRQRAFTLLAVLFLVAILGIAAAATVSAGVTMQRRSAEDDLLFVGLQYKRAFRSYYQAAISTPRYPLKLEDLLKDPRFPGIRRHLRTLYADPVTGGTDWGLILAPGGGIMGVYSLATNTRSKSGCLILSLLNSKEKRVLQTGNSVHRAGIDWARWPTFGRHA